MMMMRISFLFPVNLVSLVIVAVFNICHLFSDQTNVFLSLSPTSFRESIVVNLIASRQT